MDPREAIEKLDLFGYCIIENLLSAEQAIQLEQAFCEQHQEPAYEPWKSVEQWNGSEYLYETLYGLLLREQRSWEIVGHPLVLEVARHFIGADAFIAQDLGGTKWNKPGSSSAGSVHVDDGRFFVPPLPEMPCMINTMWMISDFTVENGATRIAPFSHKARQLPPPYVRSTDPFMIPAAGPRGSLLMWHGNTWHAQAANTTADSQRLSINLSYRPAWWNHPKRASHDDPGGGLHPVPALPLELYEGMDPELQRLVRYCVGTHTSLPPAENEIVAPHAPGDGARR